jgi:hypothetical protein
MLGYITDAKMTRKHGKSEEDFRYEHDFKEVAT